MTDGDAWTPAHEEAARAAFRRWVIANVVMDEDKDLPLARLRELWKRDAVAGSPWLAELSWASMLEVLAAMGIAVCTMVMDRDEARRYRMFIGRDREWTMVLGCDMRRGGGE